MTEHDRTCVLCDWSSDVGLEAHARFIHPDDDLIVVEQMGQKFIVRRPTAERDRLLAVLRDMGIDTEGVTGYTEAAFWADVADRLIAAGVTDLPVERLAQALRKMLGISPDDDSRYDFGDLYGLARPHEMAGFIAAAYREASDDRRA